MTIKNGVYHIRIYPDNNEKTNEKKNISDKSESIKFIANEYIISELEQILPLYSLTLKEMNILFCGMTQILKIIMEMNFINF
jgi:hypothetical protein